MNIKIMIGLSAIITILGALLYWQIKTNGTLTQANDQLTQTLADEIKASADYRASVDKTNQQLADTQVKYNQLDSYARGLLSDLKQQESQCVNDTIPSDVVDRVLRYRDGES